MTRREAEALRFLSDYENRHGFSPSLRELADGLGVRSKSSAHRIKMQLVRKGYAFHCPGSARSLTPKSACPTCGKVAA